MQSAIRSEDDGVVEEALRQGRTTQLQEAEMSSLPERNIGIGSNIFSFVFGKEKPIKKFEGLEFRPQQFEMAGIIKRCLHTKKHLIVEAGTGVGKSLAYLLPAIQWTYANNKKIVISTYTKTLQEQLIQKDLPILQQILAIDFRFALCLGSENYLCLRRLKQGDAYNLFDPGKQEKTIAEIHKWCAATKTGIRSDIGFSVEESIWNCVSRDGPLCLGRKCAFRRDCFYYKARNRQLKAHILITNHHLFFANVASGGNVLPLFDAVIFDEAHNLEDVATDYLGMKISNFQIKYFLDSLFNPNTQNGFLYGIAGVPLKLLNNARQDVAKIMDYSGLFFSQLMVKTGKGSKNFRIRKEGLIENILSIPLANLSASLKEILQYCKRDEDNLAAESYIARCNGIRLTLDTILSMRNAGLVYWIEILNRPRGIKCTLCAAPIDISTEFKEQIIDKIKPVIFTSATLSTQGSFEFMKRNLGIKENTLELVLDSPFNYEENALLYLPEGLSDPSDKLEMYQRQTIKEIIKILSVMNGRTFVLFTSFKMMDITYKELKEQFKNLLILRQADMERYRLLETFKRNSNAVLLGTSTFWQGIDVAGKALECVIITKLPFAVPDEPVVEAKMEYLVSQNKNPFIHYQLPRAIIMFKQGFGRLIRTQSDRGIVAVLDPRLTTKYYGRSFLEALPSCKKIFKLEQIKDFFYKNH